MILRGLDIFCALTQHELNDNISAITCEVTTLVGRVILDKQPF